MATPKIVADFETQLSSAVAVGATSFTLKSATDDDGVALPTGLYYFTVDNGSTQKEYLAGTLTGTSVASVVSVSRQGVETSGASKKHRVGASVIITDFLTYKKYMDEISVAGAPDASTTTKGVLEVPTTSEVNAGTSVGGTGAKLAVTTDALLASDYGLLLLGLVGSIIPTARASAPTGFLLCDGSAVSRTTYAALFSAIGTVYGVGDGSTTFNVPNMQGRVPVGRDSGQTEFDTLGETGGAKTHTLTEAELASHSHALAGTVKIITVDENESGWSSTGSAYSHRDTTEAAGGGGAHNNLQPYVVVNYIIKT
jgi:microcystin-dependent protein